MADKATFFNNINGNTEFNEEFYKKVYGYSLYDTRFLDKVATRLVEIGEKNRILSYNEWLAGYKDEQSVIMKAVARWYVEKCTKIQQGKENNPGKAAKENWNNILEMDLHQKSDGELLSLLQKLNVISNAEPVRALI